jgi:hypothetical protein
VYNALCKRSVLNATPEICDVELASDKIYSCTFEKGKDECFIDEPVYIYDGYFIGTSDGIITHLDNKSTPPKLYPIASSDHLYVSISSVVTQKDSPTQYLALQPDKLCNQQNLGCQEVGKEIKKLPGESTSSYEYNSTFILNNPKNYSQTLCTQAQIGCSQFQNGNNTLFFKDPKVTGASMCVYKTNTEVGGVKSSGWFMWRSKYL